MAIPRLQDYGVYPTSGFLPEEAPLTRLPQPCYQPWEDIVNNLPSLLLTKRVRSLIDQLPVVSADQLETVPQLRRAYSVLTFLTHAYIWGHDLPTNQLPACIAEPLLAVSEKLRVPPIATYASLCLWNYKKIIDNDKHILDDLDNLTTINTFTGSIDESWFYLVSIYFEYKGSFVINTGMQILEDVANNDIPSLIRSLQKFAEQIDHLGSVMMKMEEMCDPHVFYFRIRPYFAGWKNMSAVGMDKGGILYGNETQPRAYSGGSNAQSSLIQFLDIILGIKHFPTGERPVPHQPQAAAPAASSFNDEMREYMPGEHSDFLAKLEEAAHVREYVLAQGHSELTLSYDACLAMLKAFRDKHIQIVTRYIVLQAKKGSKMGSTSTFRSGLAKAKKSAAEEKGTGGTSLLPFLKQCRDETGDPAVGTWGKRILSDGVMRLNFSRPNGINEDDE